MPLVPDFFIEFRFHGYAKRHLKKLVYEVARRFRVKGGIRYRPMPHMALFYGSSERVDIREVCAAVEKTGKQFELVPFTVDGFDWSHGEDGRVIAARIAASPELKELRLDLLGELSKICSPHRFDTQPDFWFHTTIAFKDIDQKFQQIWDYLSKKEKPYIRQHLIRITVLNGERKIEREYDLVLKRWLNRRQALSRGVYRKTVSRLSELTGEHVEPGVSFWQRIVDVVRRLQGKSTICFIGDTHFDHGNIINYCDRPFRSVEEMNRALVKKWNALVAPGDTVYFLGDWSFGRGARSPQYWARKLTGRIVSVRGSHDNGVEGVRFERYKVLHYKGYSFLIIHDPDEKPTDWQGWVIHGHKHNNDLRDYPFINGERKTINVSVEVIDYQPLKIDKLLSLHIDSIRRMETINGRPEVW